MREAGHNPGRKGELTMRKVKMAQEDKALIRAYAKWCIAKGDFPPEYECSRLINNMNGDHRDAVEDYLSELRLKQYNNEI